MPRKLRSSVAHTRTTLRPFDILRLCKAAGCVKVTKATRVLYKGRILQADEAIVVSSKSYDLLPARAKGDQ